MNDNNHVERPGRHLTAVPTPATTQPVRVLVVEDEPDTAFFVKYTLASADFEVTLATTIEQALRASELIDFDVILSDFELPDGNGLGLADAMSRRARPVPVVVTTAHGAVDRALTALGAPVREYLLKPVRPERLVRTIEKVGRESRSNRTVVLAIGAHPGDIELGVGGALWGHRAAGHDIVIATLFQAGRPEDAEARQREAHAAADLLGARLLMHDLDDAAAADVAPIAELIEQLVVMFDPDVVYTHSAQEFDASHRAVHRATVEATREVALVACYQSASTTALYQPTRFVDVSAHASEKVELISRFDSMHASCGSIDPELLATTAQYWSRFSTGTHAEPLEIVHQRALRPAPDSSDEQRDVAPVTAGGSTRA